MAKKHIPTDGRGNALVFPKPKEYKAKPTPYKEPNWLREYRLQRERHFWKLYPKQRAQIEEHVKHMQKEWALQDKRRT